MIVPPSELGAVEDGKGKDAVVGEHEEEDDGCGVVVVMGTRDGASEDKLVTTLAGINAAGILVSPMSSSTTAAAGFTLLLLLLLFSFCFLVATEGTAALVEGLSLSTKLLLLLCCISEGIDAVGLPKGAAFTVDDEAAEAVCGDNDDVEDEDDDAGGDLRT